MRCPLVRQTAIDTTPSAKVLAYCRRFARAGPSCTWPARLYREPWQGQTYSVAVAPVMVQPSCVQTPSITVNVVSPVRETRNKPAFDSTRAAPPTFASGVPVVVTRTRALANCPWITLRSAAEPPLGPVGELPQPVARVASVAQDAMQAPQNWRREMGAVVSDMSSVIPGENHSQLGNMEATKEILGFFRKNAVRRGASITTSIANGELCKRTRPDRFNRQGP